MIGRRVIKKSKLWIPNDFDSWGRGVGIGKIVKSPDGFEDLIDVRWPGGRCFEDDDQIIIEDDMGRFFIDVSDAEIDILMKMTISTFERSTKFDEYMKIKYDLDAHLFKTIQLIHDSNIGSRILLKIEE